MDPLFPETLYAATGSGVYKTDDGADSWELASTGLPTPGIFSVQEKLLFGLQGSGDRGGVLDLALDPLNPLNIYAATKKGVYKTKDGGHNWYAVNLGLPLSGGNPFWHDRILEIDATGRVVYIAMATEQGGSRGDTQIYRAIMEPMHSLEYEFELDGELLKLESVSHVNNVTLGQDSEELRFLVAGPSTVKGKISVTIPEAFLVPPFNVTIDGVRTPASSRGQIVSFEYSHNGSSQVTITGKGG
jgi:hypothetical protein